MVDLRGKRTSELVRLWCEVTLALVERHELQTVGPPLTGLAERLVAVLFEGTLARPGQRDWDVETRNADRIQVKALWDVGRRTRRRLGAIGRDLDLLVAVVFDNHGRVAEVWEVGPEALATLHGTAPRPVVRLPWVRAHGRQLTAERVHRAAEALELDTRRTARSPSEQER